MANVSGDKNSPDTKMREAIRRQLVESGESERLKEILKTRLSECGWRNQLKEHCKEVVRQRGLDHVTVDELVEDVTPKARQLVPDSVKKELLHKIRKFVAEQENL